MPAADGSPADKRSPQRRGLSLDRILGQVGDEPPNPPPEILGQLCLHWIKDGVVTRKRLIEGLLEVLPGARGEFVGTLLVSAKVLSEDDLLHALSGCLRIPRIGLSGHPVSPEVLALVHAGGARKLGAFPLSRFGRILTLAVTNPFIPTAPLGIPPDLAVRMILCPSREILALLDARYPPSGARPEPPA